VTRDADGPGPVYLNLKLPVKPGFKSQQASNLQSSYRGTATRNISVGESLAGPP
jgi:hypothetical protein